MSYPEQLPEFAKNITMPVIPDGLKSTGYIAGDLPERQDINYIGKYVTEIGSSLQGVPSINSSYEHIEATEYTEVPYTNNSVQPPRPNKNDMINRKMTAMGETVSPIFTNVPTATWNEDGSNPIGYTAKDRSKINNRINRKLTQYGNSIQPSFTEITTAQWDDLSDSDKEIVEKRLNKKISDAIKYGYQAYRQSQYIPNYKLIAHYEEERGYGVLEVEKSQAITLYKQGGTAEEYIIESSNNDNTPKTVDLIRNSELISVQKVTNANKIDGGFISGIQLFNGDFYVWAVKATNKNIAYIAAPPSYTSSSIVAEYRTLHSLETTDDVYYRRVISSNLSPISLSFIATPVWQILGVTQKGNKNYLHNFLLPTTGSYVSQWSAYANTRELLRKKVTTGIVADMRSCVPITPEGYNYEVEVYADKADTGSEVGTIYITDTISGFYVAPIHAGLIYSGSGFLQNSSVSIYGDTLDTSGMEISVKCFYDSRID